VTISQAFALAIRHHQAGRLAEAETLYRQILAVQPKHAHALDHLGVIAQQAGRYDLAVDLIRQSIVIEPNNPAAHSNLGEACRNLGLLDEAVAACRRALELKPDLPEACLNLGNALSAQGQLDEAVAAYRRAVQFRPDYSEPHNNLANALRERGEPEDSIAEYRHALRIKPDDAATHSNLVFALHFHPGDGNGTIADERQRWDRQFGDPLKRFIQPHANDRNPDRRLRIGYVSPDFRDHVVGRNLLPLFQCHDPRNFEILSYAGVARPDKLTEGFRQRAQRWRSTVGVGDEALAQMIREDGVDILVDLSSTWRAIVFPCLRANPRRCK
jgi:protein O-GlcNAc transferase